MGSLGGLFLAWGITLVLAGFVAAILWHPMRVLLGELCATEQRSRFWTVYATIMMVLLPMLAVTLLGTDENLTRLVQGVVFYALGGIGLALVAVGWTVWSNRPAEAPPRGQSLAGVAGAE
ncbi:hypothetical protein HHL28_15755 [Aerophototrophica crusticola]|uniref:Uncharacterized protein n=1 Tax=Aerophototrophica crusticola TaxID=1709002 RepID=A0A858RBJ6_9PROT|nr:hypothetical protein HHL28_15755 [Rhodospirillaceae bacterium B3]